MPRPKRKIRKPPRYQSTASSSDDDNENNITNKYMLSKEEVQNKIENDVHVLSKVFVETQKVLNNENEELENEDEVLQNKDEVLENEDEESISHTLHHSQSSKPRIRSNIVLDPSIKCVKTTVKHGNELAMHNNSKQYDMPYSNSPNNNYVYSTSSVFSNNVQYDPKMPCVYQAATTSKNNSENITNKKYYEKKQSDNNGHGDYLYDKREKNELICNIQNDPQTSHLPSSCYESQKYIHLQNVTNTRQIKNFNNSDNSNEFIDERNENENKVQKHSATYAPLKENSIRFSSPMANDFRQLYKWMDIRFTNIERTIHSLNSKNKRKFVTKPSFLPFTSKEEVLKFDNVEEATYNELVCYLRYVGGFSLKEALNLCMKETVENEVMSFFTFYGNKEETIHSFFKTKLCSAIQEAVSENKYFHPPNSSEFRQDMIEAIRNAKQRKRNFINKNKENNKGKRQHQEDEMQQIFEQRQNKYLRE